MNSIVDDSWNVQVLGFLASQLERPPREVGPGQQEPHPTTQTARAPAKAAAPSTPAYLKEMKVGAGRVALVCDDLASQLVQLPPAKAAAPQSTPAYPQLIERAGRLRRFAGVFFGK